MAFKFVDTKCAKCGEKLKGKDPEVVNSAGNTGLAGCPNCGTGLQVIDTEAEPLPEPAEPAATTEPETEPETEPAEPAEPETEPETEPDAEPTED